MDNIKTNTNIYSTKLINTQTINYTVCFIANITAFFALKQILKVFFDVNAGIAVLAAFIAVTVTSWLCESKFAFYRGISSIPKQLIMLVFRGAVDFAFYKLCDFLFGNLLTRQSSFVFFAAISIIFFFNYYFDRLIVFECIDNAASKHSGRLYKMFFRNRFTVLSMLITFASIMFIFIVYSVFPFGDTTVMRMDLYHQYGPLFAELYDRVVGAESFFYSWQSGGGSGFLGNFFNYLASPLTAIIFFFDKKDISFAITALVALKCVLTAGSFSYYIRKSLNGNSCVSAAFGVFYAFSSYFLAYYWNVMWLDAMILLPLIALGIENIINKRNSKLYIASLAILLYSSYYMGFMCCIFSVIYFFIYFTLTQKYTEKTDVAHNMFFNRALKFGSSSVIVGLICAAALIPIFFVLRSSSATSDSFPQTFTSYFNIFDFLTSHLAGLETTIRSSGDDVLPNVYCSVLTIILVPLFVVNKEIRIKEKAVYIIALLFMLFSFDNNVMNFMWHAFHFPNDLPYRFSYMYTFLLLIIAYRAFINIKAIGTKDIAYCGMAWVFFAVLAQKTLTNKMSESTIYISIAFIIIWTGVLMMIRKGTINNFIMGVTVMALAFCEVAVADTGSFVLSQNNANYVTNYNNYIDAIDYIESKDKGFYRTELCYLNTRMDPCYYGYNGMSTFSSMAYEDYSQMQYSLGMFGNRINSYTYNTQTPVYNMMFGIKYLIYANSMSALSPSKELYTHEYTTEPDAENKTASVYLNKYYLPMMFYVNSNIDDFIVSEGDPFEAQSDWFRLTTGFSGVFIPCLYDNCIYDGIDGDDINDNGTFWFSKDSDSDYGYVNVDITAQKDGEVYCYITSPDVTTVEYQFDGSDSKTQTIDEPYIYDLGYHKAGEKITVAVNGGSMDVSDSSISIYAYSIDKDILDNGYNKLQQNTFNVTSHSDTYIKGTVTANDIGYLYTSIPCDDGWKVYIDSVLYDSKPTAVNNTMLSVPLGPGTHTVELRYTPKGVLLGTAITGTTAAAFAGYCIIRSLKKRKNCNK